MRLNMIPISLLIVAIIFSPKEIIAAEVVIAADSWCPLNCKPTSSYPGLMVEIAKVIFQKNGHTIKYIQLPWKRAISMAKSGKINGIIGAFHGDAPGFIFPKNG